MKAFVLRRVGFSQSLKINDSFEYENKNWIIRAITSNKVKGRIVGGFGGKRGYQNDVIEAEVVAQKEGTFSISNLKSSVDNIESRIDTTKLSKIDSEIELLQVGDVSDCSNSSGKIYVVTKIKDIRFSFIDIVVNFEGESITEIPEKETYKLSTKSKLNQLGWKIIG